MLSNTYINERCCNYAIFIIIFKNEEKIMNKNLSKYTRVIFTYMLFGIFLSAQQLDSKDIAYNQLKNVLETASRFQQVVWLEDFTGID